jgi:hypothetical protein
MPMSLALWILPIMNCARGRSHRNHRSRIENTLLQYDKQIWKKNYKKPSKKKKKYGLLFSVGVRLKRNMFGFAWFQVSQTRKRPKLLLPLSKIKSRERKPANQLEREMRNRRD